MSQNHLIIGLGSTGGRVLKELRKRLFDENGEIPAGIGFMYIDSSDELMQYDDPSWLTAEGDDAQFRRADFLYLSQPGGNGFTMQKRRLGRELLGANAVTFDSMLRQHVVQLQNNTEYSEINFIVVTGLSGGTGSGCVTSVTGHILRHYPEARISVMATLPPVPPPPGHDQGRYLANAYAALRELNALNIGRLQLSDLVTGEKFQPEMPYDHSLNYCNRLQENKLFRLYVFENFYNEYDKIANILYPLYLKTGNPGTGMHMRCLYMYDCINEPEFDASTPDGEKKVYARTRAVGLLGLCRIVYPREQILRHLVQASTSQAILQTLYNNYRDGIGFTDEVVEFDASTVCRQNADRWQLDYKSMTLQRPITLKDKKEGMRPFHEEWTRIIYFLGDYDEIKKVLIDHDNVFIYSVEHTEYFYDNVFRDRQGVENYFASKRNEVREYAKDILSAIEQHFLSAWQAGEYGLCQLRQIYESLRNELQKKANAIEEMTGKLHQIADDNEETIKQTLEEVARMSKLTKMLKEHIGEMQKKYLRFRENLALFYAARTEIVSLSFTKELIQALLHEVCHEEDCLMSVVHDLQRINVNIRVEADDLLARDNQPNSQNSIIDLSNRQDIEHYKKLMFADKHFMQDVAARVRTAFAGDSEQSMSIISMMRDCNQALCMVQRRLKEAIVVYDASNSLAGNIQDFLHLKSSHFGAYITSGMTPAQFIEKLYPNWEKCKDSAPVEHAKVYKELIMLNEADEAYHELINTTNILKTDTLQEVKTRFRTTDALTTFVRKALSGGCDNIQLNDSETLRAVRNNPLPCNHLASPHKAIFVRIPYADNEEEKFCSEKFKAILSGNCDITQVEVDTERSDTQEISIYCACTNFPLRCLKSLPGIKQQYDYLIANNGLQAMQILHIEDSFANLPSLEVEAYIEPPVNDSTETGDTDIFGIPLIEKES